MSMNGSSSSSASSASAADSALAVSPYTEAELKQALDSLWADSPDPDVDAAHLLGYGQLDHRLSVLQIITATVLLDYQHKLSSNSRRPKEDEENGNEGKGTPVPSLEELITQSQVMAQQYGPILPLKQVIRSTAPRMALAAEFKRASPSKGRMADEHLTVRDQAQRYAQAGAQLISVLTEPYWFQGSLADLREARLSTNHIQPSSSSSFTRPAILRKDFCVNEYMIAEAAAAGADTILLIVAVLPRRALRRLIQYARDLGLEPLVEVHAAVEVPVALECGAHVLGVNNRNLHNFQLDLATTERVAQQLVQLQIPFEHRPPTADAVHDGYVLCALSGMSTAEDVDRYRQVGVGLCLLGESFMRCPDPLAMVASLCLHPQYYAAAQAAAAPSQEATVSTTTSLTDLPLLVKVCGVTRAEDALAACQAGAHLIGLIFVPASPRCVTVEQAQAVVQAVRQFGERSDRIQWDLSNSITTSDSSTDATGAILWKQSLLTHARALVQGTKRPAVVGVFQNQDSDWIRQMVNECGLDLIQLHGSEGMEAANSRHWGGVPAIRVVHIATDPVTGQAASDAVDTILASITADPLAILLDTSLKGQKAGGGTGLAFDWTIAQKVQEAGLPVMVAGGLTPTSVQECVRNVRPLGVDVSSGVEMSPGIKDPTQVRLFVQAAKMSAQEAPKRL